MKVLYELDLNDIIRIVAEKYGVPQEKVKKTNKDGLNYLMIDMSETETPGPVPFKDYVSPFLAKKEAPTEEKKPIGGLTPETRTRAYKIAEEKAEEYGLIPPGKKEPEKQEEAEDEEEKRYEQITDERLQEYIAAERTIPQICKAYKLTDSKYSARLYKRAEQFRKEGARLGRKRNKEKAEDTEPTAG